MGSIFIRPLALLTLALASTPLTAQVAETIAVDATAPVQPFPHFWEHMFGSGRAVLSLRESYRDDLRAVRSVTALSYVRFHAILDDDIGVYSEGPSITSLTWTRCTTACWPTVPGRLLN